MTTDVQTPAPVTQDKESKEKEVAPIPVKDADAELRTEVEYLLELTKHKIQKGDMTPCPACTLLVHLTENRCHHCDSFIAANNALMRESQRRLGEIRAQLDGDHRSHSEREKDDNVSLSFGEKFKRIFAGSPEPVAPKPVAADPRAPRVLRNTAEGDPLKVVECDGPWLKVKTRDGQTGWVYSTLVIDR